jgi:hypothetical protein
MKTLILLTLLLLSAGLAAAQTPPSQTGAHGVSVIEYSWHRQSLPNPVLLEDPLGIVDEQARMDRARNEVIQQNKIRERAGVDQVPVPTGSGMNRTPPRRPSSAGRFQYLYEVKLSNMGTKKIRGLTWEYVMLDPVTGLETGRRHFTSKVSLRPGQSKKLTGRSTLPPALTVSAARDSKESAMGHSEKVEIQRVEFDDSTVWERPSQ